MELADRYAALGLTSAAIGTVEWAYSIDRMTALATQRLAEFAIHKRQAQQASEYARQAVKDRPGPDTEVLLGQAHLINGQNGAARLAFARAIETSGANSFARARAYLGCSEVAASEGDRGGTAANAMAAFECILEMICATDVSDVSSLERQFALAEIVVAQAVAFGRGADLVELALERMTAFPHAEYVVGLARSGMQVLGNRQISNTDIEGSFERVVSIQPKFRSLRMQLVEHRLGRRYKDPEARSSAIRDLEALAAELAYEPASITSQGVLARVYFLLATAYEDDPSTVHLAEQAYRRGLSLRPRYATAANRLAMLLLSRRENQQAGEIVQQSLSMDAQQQLTWLAAARVLNALAAGDVHVAVTRQLLDACLPGIGAMTGKIVSRLVHASAQVVRAEVLAGMHTHGHRLKNLLGILGARTRTLRKVLGSSEAVPEELAKLESEATSAYNEWADYLGSLQASPAAIEIISVSALVIDVVASVSERTSIFIHKEISGSLPDLRGDRALLRDALLNIVSNAAEACLEHGGEVNVIVRTVSKGGAPAIRIEVVDTGPGIPEADVRRVFAPGFTTKNLGSGVGLAVAERAISAHYGRVLLDTEEGRGTRVTILLPSDLGEMANLATFPVGVARGDVE